MISTLFISTGEIHTGKTTSIFKLLNLVEGIDGILQPRIEDKRFLYCIKEKHLIPLEAAEGEEDTVQIGRYQFLNSSFEKANQYLCNIHSAETICIDEIGPLELQGLGLMKGFEHVILQETTNTRVLVVVRANLLNEVKNLIIRNYGITPTIIYNEVELINRFSRKTNKE